MSTESTHKRLWPSLDEVIDQIGAKGYTVETRTNMAGNRYTYRLWKDGQLFREGLGDGTWDRLENMYGWILTDVIGDE